jgi:uncharacterized protein (UPF0276 family)
MNNDNVIWGVGLRPTHYADWHAEPVVPAIEIMADNLLHHRGGPALWHTHRVVERAAFCVMHGVGMNLGGTSPLSSKYLDGLKELIALFKPKVVSDHLCFTQADGLQSYELLPLIRNKTTIEHVVHRIDTIQQSLGVRFSIENVSAYVNYIDDEIPEGDFMSEIAERSGCGILLDVNNIFVGAMNFNLDPEVELKRFNFDAVTQVHVAGHSKRDDFLFDTHDTDVCSEVWSLLSVLLSNLSAANKSDFPIILENDNRETSLAQLLREVEYGRQLCLESVRLAPTAQCAGSNHV